jgi:hypothetical protein
LRPRQSQNLNDLEALTFGHFLIGAPLTAPYESDRSQHQRPHEVATDHPTPAALLEKVAKGYLSQLQTRPRGQQHQHPNVDVGALVVLIEDNFPPLQWRLGRVVQVHPGSDGVVRVVSVKTISGRYECAVKKKTVHNSNGSGLNNFSSQVIFFLFFFSCFSLFVTSTICIYKVSQLITRLFSNGFL